MTYMDTLTRGGSDNPWTVHIQSYSRLQGGQLTKLHWTTLGFDVIVTMQLVNNK